MKSGIDKTLRVENIETAKMFTIFDAPKLDPVTVILQNVGPGCGRLVIECYGSAWAGYWGAMGDIKLMEFLVNCNPEYIAKRMRPTDRAINKREEAYLLRIVEVVLAVLRSNSERVDEDAQ